MGNILFCVGLFNIRIPSYPFYNEKKMAMNIGGRRVLVSQ